MANSIKIKVNGLTHGVSASLDTPLLYVLHNELHLHGPRFGCGLAQCGACSVLLDGKEIRSCVSRREQVGGLDHHPVLAVTQCGTCTSIHACCNGCSVGAAAVVPRCAAYRAGSPSSVVMLFPLTAATGVTHERISFPSSSTEQAPHCARPQPKRGPCRWSSLCSTYRRGVSRLALTPCVSPFTLILMLFAIPPPR